MSAWNAIAAVLGGVALSLIGAALWSWWRTSRLEGDRHESLARLAQDALDATRDRTDDVRAIPDSERRLRAAIEEYRRASARRDPGSHR